MNYDEMLKKVETLKSKLEDQIGPGYSGFDALYEYRLFWDHQGINSEGDDGWPKSFCFLEENIEKFGEYWKGEIMI